ncbi:hypothetical protein OQA88_9809 [Cercophora sp. LCS_1]
MSTIASPRDPSTPLNRRMPSSQAATTPTSSTRPSLDIGPLSTASSPNPNVSAPAPAPAPSKRANRAALREYYNIKQSPLPTVEVTISSDLTLDTLTVPSELDAPDFDAESYISHTLASSSLSDLLRTYARVLGEIRALDAEKKALVYDNYSKLISATETIRRMQTTMDPLHPIAGTLDLVIKGIYEQAVGVREDLRRNVARGDAQEERRKRTREVAKGVLQAVGRMRQLVEEGKADEAKRQWDVPRRLLVRWAERGLGGGNIGALIEEGDKILNREPERKEFAEEETESEGESTT